MSCKKSGWWSEIREYILGSTSFTFIKSNRNKLVEDVLVSYLSDCQPVVEESLVSLQHFTTLNIDILLFLEAKMGVANVTYTYLYSVCSIAHTATSSTSSSSLATGEATISSSWASTLSCKILTKTLYIWPVYAVCCLLQGSLLSPRHGAN